jgi:molecular chaperone DnaK (HSP70)
VMCPRPFSTQAQREATRRAGTLAGFKEVATLTEPFAAAIAYGFFVAGNAKTVRARGALEGLC